MLVWSAIADLSVPLIDHEQTELDPLVLSCSPWAPWRNVGSDPELFLQLSRERFLERLVLGDVTSGHIPNPRIVFALAASKTEKHTIAIAQYGAHDFLERRVRQRKVVVVNAHAESHHRPAARRRWQEADLISRGRF
jgi:hypothetical protein